MHRAVKRAFLIGLFQIFWALLFSASPGPEGRLSDRYFQLINWDSQHYQIIASQGYRIPEGRPITSDAIHNKEANVVFFPGYAMAARGLSHATGFSVDLSLLLVAQLACIVFWTYVLLLLESYGVKGSSAGWTVAALVLHPASFFLVCAYTEPLFLAGMLGFIYWSDRWAAARTLGLSTAQRAGIFAVAGAHGFVMSATRIVSFALAPYPTLKTNWDRKRIVSSALLGLFCTLGAVAFFAWCQRRFGAWNLYFQLEEIGWRNHRRWFALLDPWTYIPRFFFEHTVDSFNRASVPFTVFLFGMAAWFEKGKAAWKRRIPLYLTAFVLFYIPLTGKANANMDSMIRYTFPVFAVLSLCFAQIHQERLDRGESGLWASSPRWARALIILGSLLSIAIQGWFIYRFLRGKWVA